MCITAMIMGNFMTAMTQDEFMKIQRNIARAMGIKTIIKNSVTTYTGSAYDIAFFQRIMCYLAEEFTCDNNLPL